MIAISNRGEAIYMTVEFKEIEILSEQLSSFYSRLPDQIERLKKEISLCDHETNDLLHLIELDHFNASDGFRHAKDLQITRKRRRECKDELEGLNEIVENLKIQRPFNHQVITIEKLIKARKEKIKMRGYQPRVRKDLKKKFKECRNKHRKFHEENGNGN